MQIEFRLLKDHPYAKKGSIVRKLHDDLECVMVGSNVDGIAASFGIPFSVKDEWLEPADVRWAPKQGEDFYYMDSDFDVYQLTWKYDWKCSSAHGNCFSTREKAEEAAKRIKACLSAYHEEIGE